MCLPIDKKNIILGVVLNSQLLVRRNIKEESSIIIESHSKDVVFTETQREQCFFCIFLRYLNH